MAGESGVGSFACQAPLPGCPEKAIWASPGTETTRTPMETTGAARKSDDSLAAARGRAVSEPWPGNESKQTAVMAMRRSTDLWLLHQRDAPRAQRSRVLFAAKPALSHTAT